MSINRARNHTWDGVPAEQCRYTLPPPRSAAWFDICRCVTWMLLGVLGLVLLAWP